MRLTVKNEKYIYTLDTAKNMIIHYTNGLLKEQVSTTAVCIYDNDIESIKISKCGNFIALKSKSSVRLGATYQLDKISGEPILLTAAYAEKIREKF